MASHTTGDKQDCASNWREELKPDLNCRVHPFRNGGGFGFSQFLHWIVPSQSQPLPGSSSSLLTEVLCHYQEERQGADLEHCYPGDISQPLDIHSSWISVPLCLASLKVYIAQVNQNLILLKTLAFPNITNSNNLPWVRFSGTMAFPIKSLLHSSFIVIQFFQAEEQWGAGMSLTPFDPFVTLLPQSLSPSCSSGKDALNLATVSHVPCPHGRAGCTLWWQS